MTGSLAKPVGFPAPLNAEEGVPKGFAGAGAGAGAGAAAAAGAAAVGGGAAGNGAGAALPPPPRFGDCGGSANGFIGAAAA